MKAIELAARLLELANTFEKPEEVEVILQYEKEISSIRLESGKQARLVLVNSIKP